MAFQPRALRLTDLSLPQDNTAQTLAGLGQTLMQNYDAGLERKKLEQEREATLAASAAIMGASAPSFAVPQPQQQPLASLGQTQQPQLPAFAQMQGAPQGKSLQSLIQNESGGRWDAQNNVVGAGGKTGHFGRLQFGQARLEDAMNAGVIPRGTTPEQFMANPSLQQKVEDWHFRDNWNSARKMGLDGYVGQTVAGIPITQQGILAGAHLGGVGGVAKFLQTGGAYNPADANGTRISDYVARHGGADAPSPNAVEAQAVTSPSLTQTDSIASRYERAAQTLAAQAQATGNVNIAKKAQEFYLKAQELKAKETYGFQTVGDQLVRTNPRTGQAEAIMSKPMNPLDEQLKRAQIKEYESKIEKKPTSVQEYEYARAQGYQGSMLDYQKAVTEAKTRNAGISASDQKAIFQSEDEIPLLDNTINTLKRASELNKQTYTGYTAGLRGKIGSSMPMAGLVMDKKTANATREFDQIMSLEAIKSMSETLKGATTDKEMSRFLDILGDPSTDPEIRGRTINRMLELAERQKSLLASRINELRSKDPKRSSAQQTQPQPNNDGWQDMGGGIRIRAK